MLASRPIVVCLVLIFSVDFISTMLEPTLSIHLYEVFQMNAWERGLLFAEAGFFGVLCAPLASILGECGRGPAHRKMLVLIGLFMTSLCVCGLGVCATGGYANMFMCFLGVSLAFVAVPCMPAMLWDIPDDSDLTDGEVARVVNHVAAIAAVLGPIWGSGMAEGAGFKVGVGVTAAIVAVGATVMAIMYGCKCMEWKNPIKLDEDGDEIEPILGKQGEVPRDKAGPEEPINVDGILGWFGMGEKTAKPGKTKEAEPVDGQAGQDAESNTGSSRACCAATGESPNPASAPSAAEQEASAKKL
jgi:MFS family permease